MGADSVSEDPDTHCDGHIIPVSNRSRNFMSLLYPSKFMIFKYPSFGSVAGGIVLDVASVTLEVIPTGSSTSR